MKEYVLISVKGKDARDMAAKVTQCVEGGKGVIETEHASGSAGKFSLLVLASFRTIPKSEVRERIKKFAALNRQEFLVKATTVDPSALKAKDFNLSRLIRGEEKEIFTSSAICENNK